MIKQSSGKVRRGSAVYIERSRVAAYCRVSTDSAEQLSSYKSQVTHYESFVQSKPEWEFAGIYADEGISGTQAGKRTEFQRMIQDSMDGKVDLIITKSISRFARNTLDTLKYVRMLKENNVAVIFEKENINTLTMNGEMLLTILSSLAQQESESISANVKLGIKMKMKRGELIGFHGCWGYTYDSVEKTITINEKEAETVRYIFNRYADGVGCFVIAKELTNLGIKTKKGYTIWSDSVVRGILKNEKYKGDILMGKTFTVDPITHKRLANMGEEDQYYISGHHDAIISDELYERVQVILNRRGSTYRKGVRTDKFSQQYAFSSMIHCGCCGSLYTRRSWNATTKHKKVVWQCVTSTKKGRKFCPDSKAVDEKLIEDAFVKTFQLICSNNREIVNDFISRVYETLNENSISKEITKIESQIFALEEKIKKLIDLKLEDLIDKENYELKSHELTAKLFLAKEKYNELHSSLSNDENLRKRIFDFKKVFEKKEILEDFDADIFKNVIEKVVVGKKDEEGNIIDPYKITFVFKTGYTAETMNEVKKRGRKKQQVETDEKYVPIKDTTHIECVVGLYKK